LSIGNTIGRNTTGHERVIDDANDDEFDVGDDTGKGDDDRFNDAADDSVSDDGNESVLRANGLGAGNKQVAITCPLAEYISHSPASIVLLNDGGGANHIQPADSIDNVPGIRHEVASGHDDIIPCCCLLESVLLSLDLLAVKVDAVFWGADGAVTATTLPCCVTTTNVSVHSCGTDANNCRADRDDDDPNVVDDGSGDVQ
jgi:hypothetical protein